MNIRHLRSPFLFALSILYFSSSSSIQIINAWQPPSSPSFVSRPAARPIIKRQRVGITASSCCLFESIGGEVKDAEDAARGGVGGTRVYYTKGAEIYPSCNNRQFTLADSFPNGIIPPQAQSILRERNVNISASSLSSSSSSSSLSSRRNFLLLGGGAGISALAAMGTKIDFQSPAKMTTTTTTMDVSKAIEWLDKYCDRRFLHAMVASDYKFLYYGIGSKNDAKASSVANTRNEIQSSTNIQTVTLPFDLLSIETYGTQKAVEYFQSLESSLENELVKPSNGHLMTTSIDDAAKWGSVASMWPMDGAHFAWFQDGKPFYPREDVVGGLGTDNVQELLVVDGIDCGREGLEDALRARHCEILVNASEFLVVPVEFEQEFRTALGNSFLV